MQKRFSYHLVKVLPISDQFYLEAIYTRDVSPKFLSTHYRVENPGKCHLVLPRVAIV